MSGFGFHPRAQAELLTALRWYKAKGEGLADRFLEDFEQTVDSVRRQPAIFARVDVPTGPDITIRRARFRDFPYSVVFYVQKDGSTHVVAVPHQKRRPFYWFGRVEG